MLLLSNPLPVDGAILIANSRSQAFDWANRVAPEHITIEKKDLLLVRNAGSIFIGDYSAQAAGDYASGPNHVLPTAERRPLSRRAKRDGFCKTNFGSRAFSSRLAETLADHCSPR